MGGLNYERSDDIKMKKSPQEIIEEDDSDLLFTDFLRQARGELTAEELIIGLVNFGLFTEKLPPCFKSQGLWAEIENKYISFSDMDEDGKGQVCDRMSHDYIRYDSMRETNVPRGLGIPHPEANTLLAKAIFDHWEKIKTHCNSPSKKFSRIHVRFREGTQKIFEMNYKGTERFKHEEEELEWQTDSNFLVKSDISTCFPRHSPKRQPQPQPKG